CLQYKNFPLTF
nr:immunoglobulin light chain junction region [Macaca mulatta]